MYSMYICGAGTYVYVEPQEPPVDSYAAAAAPTESAEVDEYGAPVAPPVLFPGMSIRVVILFQ